MQYVKVHCTDTDSNTHAYRHASEGSDGPFITGVKLPSAAGYPRKLLVGVCLDDSVEMIAVDGLECLSFWEEFHILTINSACSH